MTHVPSSTPLTHFKLISFDVFGTLIDWETGIYNSLISNAPFSSLPSSSSLNHRKTLLEAFDVCERNIEQEQPGLEYADVLASVFRLLVKEKTAAGEMNNTDGETVEQGAISFAKSLENWPAFPDSVAALEKLHKYYKYLIPLSNSSPTTLGPAIANSLKGFPFTTTYTAAQIGSYKPDLNNFMYLLDHVKQDYGVGKDEVLHVGQSLHHDHEPATKMGLEGCWVDRNGVIGQVNREDSDARFGWEVKSLEELADLVERAFEAEA
jgi:2-haloalkanoic acid dehalogenase type II